MPVLYPHSLVPLRGLKFPGPLGASSQGDTCSFQGSQIK